MSVELVASLREKGLLNEEQAAVLDAVESRRLFSVAAELRALLYLGALLIVAGVGAVVKRHFEDLGPLSVAAALGLAVLACFAYCFRLGPPFSRGRVEAPNAAFDYVLYLGCALLGIELAYLERQFHLLGAPDFYLLGSLAACLALAYRFDNRLVLSLGLVNGAAWLGLTLRAFDLSSPYPFIWTAAGYGTLLALAGEGGRSAGLKAHFFETYLSFGLQFLFAAFTAGTLLGGWLSPYPWALGALAFETGRRAVAAGRFSYLASAVVYAYIGFSRLLLSLLGFGFTTYLLFSSAGVIAYLFRMRRALEERR